MVAAFYNLPYRPLFSAEAAMTKKATAKRVPLTGADHHLFMLLAAIDGGDRRSEDIAVEFARYQDRARQILKSPHAFDQGADTLSVTDCVLHEDGDRFVAGLLEMGDHDPVTIESAELRARLYRAISESTLYGAALMFELLKSGT
jgi:hypothetical protein